MKEEFIEDVLTEKEREDLANGKPSWKTFMVAFSILFTIIPVSIHYLYEAHQRKAIRQNHSLTTGVITRLAFRGGKGRNFYWTYAEYRVNGVPFISKGKAFRTLKSAQRDSLVGLKLPVIYERTEPSNSELLYSEAQFNRFNLDFPDSLGWTRSYFLE